MNPAPSLVPAWLYEPGYAVATPKRQHWRGSKGLHALPAEGVAPSGTIRNPFPQTLHPLSSIGSGRSPWSSFFPGKP